MFEQTNLSKIKIGYWEKDVKDLGAEKALQSDVPFVRSVPLYGQVCVINHISVKLRSVPWNLYLKTRTFWDPRPNISFNTSGVLRQAKAAKAKKTKWILGSNLHRKACNNRLCASSPRICDWHTQCFRRLQTEAILNLFFKKPIKIHIDWKHYLVLGIIRLKALLLILSNS